MVKVDLLRFLKHFRPAGYTTFVAIEPDGPTQAGTFNGADRSATAAWINDQNIRSGRGVYFTVNPTESDLVKKPTKEDITEIAAVWADIDPRADAPWADERTRLEHLADELHALPSPPTLTIDSGNGLQPVWMLADPIEATPNFRETAESLCRQIEHALGANGTHNVDRLLRVPGTINFPNARKRKLGRVETKAQLLRWTDSWYSWADLEALVEQLEKHPPDHAIPIAPSVPRGAPEERPGAIPEITKELRARFNAALAGDPKLRACWEGEPPAGADQSRSAFDLKLAGAMRRQGGFTLEEYAALARKWEHGKGADGDPRHFVRAWKKVGEDTAEAALAQLVEESANDPATPFESDKVDFLAALRMRNPAAYERARLRLRGAKVRVSALDEQVARRRSEVEAGTPGHRLEWPEIEPWSEVVDGAALADALAGHLQRFAIMPAHGTCATILFALHCHAIDAATHTPRLLITSPIHECGKGQVVNWLDGIVPRPFSVIDPTGPTLFRPIEAYQPTVLIDEADQVAWDDRRDLLAVIHSGHCRFGAGVPRCIGDANDVVTFRVWAPLALAMIGKPKAVMLSRSIVVRMERKAPEQMVEHRRVDRDQGFENLRRQCARWASDHLQEVRDADPELPVDGRRADCWRPLVAIADQLGGDWPERAREAAKALSGIEKEDETIGVQLLLAIRTIFDQRSYNAFATETLLDHLHNMPEQPWSEYGRQRTKISPMQLATLLRPFGLKSRQIKIGGVNKRGFRRTQFIKIWERYL